MSAKKTLVLWRHGQTDYNLGMRIQGQIDIPLNSSGEEQARRAAQVLRELPITRIIASPLDRAVATARAVAELCALSVETDERLMERDFGQWEGLTGPEIAAGWPGEFTTWRDWGDPDSKATGVETRAEVGRRVAAALRDYAEQMPEDEDTTWLFVTHGSASTQGIVEMLQLSPAEWCGLRGMDNCHWAVLENTPRQPGWKIVGYNLGAQDTRI